MSECSLDVHAGLSLSVYMLSVCCLNGLPLSYVTPRIVGNGCSMVDVTGIGALKRATCGLVLYLQLYGVISETMYLFV